MSFSADVSFLPYPHLFPLFMPIFMGLFAYIFLIISHLCNLIAHFLPCHLYVEIIVSAPQLFIYLCPFVAKAPLHGVACMVMQNIPTREPEVEISIYKLAKHINITFFPPVLPTIIFNAFWY